MKRRTASALRRAFDRAGHSPVAEGAHVIPDNVLEQFWEVAFESGLQSWSLRDGGRELHEFRKRVGQTHDAALSLLLKVAANSKTLAPEVCGDLNKAINLIKRMDLQ